MRNGLNIEWPEGNEGLDEFLRRMIQTDNQTRTITIDKPILHILDGLDEYHESGSSAMNLVNNKIPEIFVNFSNVKIIYTTRLNKEFENLGITKKYLRMLPFNEEQVNT